MLWFDGIYPLKKEIEINFEFDFSCNIQTVLYFWRHAKYKSQFSEEVEDDFLTSLSALKILMAGPNLRPKRLTKSPWVISKKASPSISSLTILASKWFKSILSLGTFRTKFPTWLGVHFFTSSTFTLSVTGFKNAAFSWSLMTTSWLGT